jgi:hypothetical protein
MSFVATIEIDEENFFWLESLRRERFPAERNLLSAHLRCFTSWASLRSSDCTASVRPARRYH